MLAALAYWGSRTGDGTVTNVVLAIGAPLLAAVVWGLLAAPRSSMRLRQPPRLVLELVIFGLAVLALGRSGQRALALVFAIAVVLVTVAVQAIGEDEPARHS